VVLLALAVVHQMLVLLPGPIALTPVIIVLVINMTRIVQLVYPIKLVKVLSVVLSVVVVLTPVILVMKPAIQMIQMVMVVSATPAEVNISVQAAHVSQPASLFLAMPMKMREQLFGQVVVQQPIFL
jgi:hypothetical protein